MTLEASASTLAAFSQAITESINKSLTESINKSLDKKIDSMESNMNAKFENIKEELSEFKRDQTNTLDKMMDTLVTRQETFEAANDEKLKALETSMKQRQSDSEKRNDSQLHLIQEQLTSLSATVEQLPHVHRAQQLPPHPALLPQPHFLPEKSYSAAIATETPAVVYNEVQLESIKDIINNVKYIVGFTPIKMKQMSIFTYFEL